MSSRRVPWRAIVVLSAGVAAGMTSLAQEPSIRQPFRAGVDIIEVDVQVTGRDGVPVPDLTPDKFEVRIAGQRRRVRTAQFVRYGDPSAVASAPLATPAGALAGLTPDQAMAGRRLFLVAVDALTFSQADTRGVVVATRGFIEQLPETDLVGLLTFPTGPKVDPTTDHGEVSAALDQVAGQRTIATSRFSVQPSEVVDWMASRDERPPIVARHCGSPAEAGCPRELALEIESNAAMSEAQAQTSLGRLRAVIDGLAVVPGRKILVLASAGLLVSDRTGGRPDIGDLPQQLGEAAARANVTIYALYVDVLMLRQFSAEQRIASRQRINVARESDILGRWLDQFSGSAGGSMIKVTVDSGEAAYRQIARETSAHYLLAVEPDRSDRSGSARRIQVRVTHPNTTVRARQWVVLPEA